jgi:TonB family protein
MRTTIIISCLLHIVLILIFQEAFPIRVDFENLRVYRVELFRPPLDDLDMEGSGKTEISGPAPEEKEASEVEEDTISLDTKEPKYVSYASVLKGRIASQWGYPIQAREQLLEGQTQILFSLNRDGSIIRVVKIATTGYDILDDEAIRAIKEAAPFPSFPSHITVKRLNIRANFDYRITAKR